MRLYLILHFVVLCISAAPRTKRVIGGWNADNGQFGFIVSLRRDDFKHWCGGTILNPTTIVTAAHCVYQINLNEGWVIAGTNYISTGGDTYAIKETICHEDYDPSNVFNDIAIIKTETPMTFYQNVTSAEIAPKRTADGDTLLFTGWGTTDSFATINADQLQYLQLSKLNLENCAELMEGALLQDSQVCAAAVEDKGLCNGDSGGPLVNYDYQLVGLASWGTYPCTGSAIVFTRVGAYENWIAKYL